MEEEWTPIVGEWVWDNLHEHCLQIIEISKQENLRLKDQGWTYKKQCRPALPHEIPNNQSNQTIDIGDEVSTYDGNGIVIGIDDSNNYLIKGAKKQHKGSVSSYIKGGPSDEKDSYFYSKDQITLVKKANNNTATRIDTARELGLVFIDTNVPSTKEILKFEIYNQKPSIKKEEFIELNINLTKNIKKPIKL